MTTKEINHEELAQLDEMLSQVEPDHIPSEYVEGARVTTSKGFSRIIDTDELEELMQDELTLEAMDIVEVRLILNMGDIKRAIQSYADEILSSIPR